MTLTETIIRIIADGTVIPVVLIGAYMLIFKIPKGHRLEAYSRILLAGLTAYLLAKLASVIYHPSDLRPFEMLGVPAGASFLNNPGFPSDHTLFSNRSACHYNLCQYGKALEDGEKCIGVKGDWGKGYQRRAMALHALQRREEAIKDYEKGIELDPAND